MRYPVMRGLTTAGAAALLVAALQVALLPSATAAPGLLGNAGSTVGGVAGGALGSGGRGAAAGPAGAAAGGSADGGGAAGAGGAAGGSAGRAGAAGAGAATIVAAAGVGDIVDAELAGRSFLASPVATRVAPGRGSSN